MTTTHSPQDNPTPSYIVGIDLGGTHFQVGVIANDEQNTIVGRARGKTLAHEGGGEAVVDRLVIGIQEACTDAKITLENVSGIGVGTPSPIDHTFRIALHAVNLDWRNFPLADSLTAKLGGNLPVTLDNDVNCAVWGEHCLGAGRKFSSLLGLWIGTGIGGGLVFNNQIFHGARGTAGEIGQTVLYPDRAPAEWLYEDHASRKSIIDRVANALAAGEQSSLSTSPDNQISSHDLAKAVEAGDDLACRIVEDSARMSGIMAANAVTMLSLECVVIGGGIAEVLPDTYIHWMRAAFDQAVFPPALKSCEISATQLKENAGLLGAALLAKTRLI